MNQEEQREGSPARTGWSTDHHVSRWQAGSAESFELLYQRFAPLLTYRVRHHGAWSVLGKRFQTEDVVQEIWARVVPAAQNRFTPSGTGSFLAFLGTVAERTMIDLTRRATAVRRDGGEMPVPLESEDADAMSFLNRTPTDTPTSRARISEIETLAAEELSERELVVWELVEGKDYSSVEAALALDCTDAAVRGLLRRARAKLALRMARE